MGEVGEVRDRHARELMAIEGVVGLAIGRTETDDDAVVVYALDDGVRARVPSELEGYPVSVQVTGEISAYRDPR